MRRDEASALVQRLLDAAKRGDIDSLADCYHDDAVAVSPVFGEVHGKAAIAGTWRTLTSTFADISVDVADMLIDGDRVAVLSSISTTDRFGWFGLRPTGSSIDYRLVLLLTIAEGKIARDERIYDSAGVVQRLEKARLENELRIAAEVQRMLLSETALRSAFSESVGHSMPCRTIGGDFFEFAQRDGVVTVTMGDVSGKGPAAALLASMLQGMFSLDAVREEAPAATLARLNEELLRRRLSPRFATLVRAVLTTDGRLAYSNGGHNPPLLVRTSGIRRLRAGGPIVGALPGATFDEETLQLAPGDTIVMFTDGVTEARNARNEEFGDERLIDAIVRAGGNRPPRLLAAIVASVSEFCGPVEQADDITVTVTRFR